MFKLYFQHFVKDKGIEHLSAPSMYYIVFLHGGAIRTCDTHIIRMHTSIASI